MRKESDEESNEPMEEEVDEESSESEYEEVWSDDYEVEDASIAFLNPSQPCFNKRGASYTPPGWKKVRVLKKRKICKQLFTITKSNQ